MKTRSNVASLAALTLGVAMVVAAPAFAQSQVSQHKTQKAGAAATMPKIKKGQPAYTPLPLFNFVPQQPAGLGCEPPLSPGGVTTYGYTCGGPGYNPAPKF